MTADSSIGEALWRIVSNKDVFIAAASTAVVVASAVWAVVRFLDKRELEHRQTRINDLDRERKADQDLVARERQQSEERHAAKIAALERDLASCTKRLASDEAEIDPDFPALNEFEPIDLPSSIPQDAEYLPRYGVIVQKSTRGSAWTAQESTHEKVFSEWFGDNLRTDSILKQGYSLVEQAASQPCMLWKGTSEKTVDDNPVIKRMYPFVIVRALEYARGTDPTTDELLNFMIWLRYFDAAVPKMKFKILRMHRSERQAYVRGHFEFDGLTVDGKHYDNYYLMRQVVIVRSDSHVYAIYTGFPNPDLTDPYFSYLKDWWNAFRIVKR